MLGRETTKYLLAKNAGDCDIAVLEGAMGFYDGMGKTEQCSAYDLARVTKTPVILVIKAYIFNIYIIMLSLKRYSPGVIPTVFLNALLKLAVLLNPHFDAISIILRLLSFFKSCIAASIRREFI